MSEALGLASSIIGIAGFAGQCVSGLRELQSLIRDYKDAPGEIAVMVEELEELEVTTNDLAQLIQQSAQITPTVNPAKPLYRCLHAVKTAAKVAQDLQKDIKVHKRLASIKAAWAKRTLENYKTRIHRAQSSLSTAFSAFQQ